MARQRGVDTKIQVTRGFVTEFTPVAFPQEAAIDIDNCIIDTDGSVRRRPGLDYEPSALLNTIDGGVLAKGDIETQAFSTFLWEFVGNSGTLNIVAQQVGAIIQFYTQEGAVSSNLLGEVDLTTFAVDTPQLPTHTVEMTSGLGALFIASPYIDPVKVTYDGSTFIGEAILIQERDFIGLPDTGAIDLHTDALINQHYYNLLNQGWTDENILKYALMLPGTDICAGINVIGALLTVLPGEVWPNNSDIMTVGIVVNTSGNLVFDADFIKDDFLGNTPAPKGHFILEAFNKQYGTVADCTEMGSDVTSTRPEAIAFHQGRVFYSSAVREDKGNGVFYSQQLLADDRVGKCFQEADPTASEINDLVATDGGFLPLPGVGQIFHMEELGNGVVVLASNGVWYITGAEVGSAITATNIRVDKLHSSGTLSASSVVQAEGQIYFFGVEGIMQVVLNDTGGANVVNITQNSIQTFYVNISASARAKATTVFIPEQRKIYWAYRDTAATDTQTSRNYNRFLILDLDVKGFYKYSIGEDFDSNFPEIVGLSLVKPLAANVETLEIITESDLTPVTLIDGSVLTQTILSDGAQISELKIATMAFDIASGGYKLTFSTFHDRSFTDWRTFDTLAVGLPISSFVEFAEFNLGAVHTRGKPTYVHSYFSTTSKNLTVGGYYELPPL